MNTIKSIYYYVYIGCIIGVIYCFFQVAPDDATWNDITKYGFLTIFFGVGAMASRAIWDSNL